MKEYHVTLTKMAAVICFNIIWQMSFPLMKLNLRMKSSASFDKILGGMVVVAQKNLDAPSHTREMVCVCVVFFRGKSKSSHPDWMTLASMKEI